MICRRRCARSRHAYSGYLSKLFYTLRWWAQLVRLLSVSERVIDFTVIGRKFSSAFHAQIEYDFEFLFRKKRAASNVTHQTNGIFLFSVCDVLWNFSRVGRWPQSFCRLAQYAFVKHNEKSNEVLRHNSQRENSRSLLQ